MPRVIEFEGQQHSFPDDATDAEIEAALGGDTPAPAQTAPSFGERAKNFLGGVGAGVFSIPQHVAALGAEATDALGLTHGAYDSVNAANEAATARGNAEGVGLDPNSGAYKVGHPVGQVAATLPLAAVNPFGGAGVLPAIGNGAVQGAAAGALTGSPDEVGKDATVGGVLGGGLNAITHGAAAMLTPVIRPAVQALSRAGVAMSPGQILGGTAKRFEDFLTSIPIAGDPIKNVQRQSLRDFGTGAGNIAMGGLGPIPPGISGQAMSTTAHNILDDAYEQVLPQLNVTLGPDFAQAVNGASSNVAARLPDAHSQQFGNTIADVMRKMGVGGDVGPANTFSGRAAKDAYSDLGRSARDFQTPMASPNDRALGLAFGDVQEGLRQEFGNSDPLAAGVLNNIDSAYRNFIPVDAAIGKATGNAGGLEAGVFTPQQLRQAVVQGDRSVRKMATAQGGNPLQQYAENGIETLPSSVPDSGTAGRLGLLEMFAHPHWVLPAALTHAVYNGPVVGAVNRAFAQGPSQGATALADIFRNLGTVGAAPAGALAGGGK
jgi:hypothetical protein